MLELKNVKKYYNNRLVLDIAFLQLEKGIYWIRGANGSGKTTLLKMIAGLIPFEGDVLFNEISLAKDVLVYRKNVSWAAAEPLFPAFMTGMNLIDLYKNIRKASQQEKDSLIEFFKMTDYINDATGTYSAGMIKRLSLLLAFIGNPALIILDEPLITLDPEAFILISDLIIEKHKNNGTSFLLSSHQDLDAQLLVSGKELRVNNQTISYT